MSKKKIKIRDSIFLLVIICALIFIGKITKLNDLRAEKAICIIDRPFKWLE